MTVMTRRTPPAGKAPSKAAKPVSSGYRGSAGLQKMREEQASQEARKEAVQMNMNMPFRFFCEAGGASKEIVIIDYSIEEVFWRFEHNLKDARTGRYNIFTACINENANCPVCKVADRPSYYAMYLTVIDLTPYTTNDGTEMEWSKKLLVVKSAQQKKITRLAERHKGNLRGMILQMTRDGDRDASIGNDIEFVDFMSEEDLETYEMDLEFKRNGKMETKHVVGHEPFDYDELFPMPTEQQLRAVVGGRPEPGSREDNEPQRRGRNDRGGNRGGGDDWEDEEKPKARPSARGPAAKSPAPRRSSREIDPDDNPETGADPDEEEAPAPRTAARTASKGKAAPATAQRRGVKAAEPEEEEETEEEEEIEEDEEEVPPPRRASMASRAAPPKAKPAGPAQRAAPARRPARADPEEEPEEEEEEEDAPAARRSATQSLAERRRALRR